MKAGKQPIESATNHSLRRTFCALLYEAGATPPYVMAQMGHTGASLALEVYSKVMEHRRDTGQRMDALLRGADWETLEIPEGDRERSARYRQTHPEQIAEANGRRLFAGDMYLGMVGFTKEERARMLGGQIAKTADFLAKPDPSPGYQTMFLAWINDGRCVARTRDLLLVRQALSQLS